MCEHLRTLPRIAGGFSGNAQTGHDMLCLWLGKQHHGALVRLAGVDALLDAGISEVSGVSGSAVFPRIFRPADLCFDVATAC